MPLLTTIPLTVPSPDSQTLFKSDVTTGTLTLREAIEGPSGVMHVCGLTYSVWFWTRRMRRGSWCHRAILRGSPRADRGEPSRLCAFGTG